MCAFLSGVNRWKILFKRKEGRKDGRKEGKMEGRKERWKEGNVLFNVTPNTFYLRLSDVRHMVKDNSDSEGRKCFI